MELILRHTVVRWGVAEKEGASQGESLASPPLSQDGRFGQLGKSEDEQFAKGITKKQTFPSWPQLACDDNYLVGWNPSHSYIKTRAYVSTYRWHSTIGFACSHGIA